MRNGFSHARRLHEKALDEFCTGLKGNDRDSMRQGAEKGWLAAVEAAKALLTRPGRPAPSGTRRQLDGLFHLSRKDRRARPLFALFGLVRERLHISCFYDDDFRPGLVEAILREELDELIQTAERLAPHNGSRSR